MSAKTKTVFEYLLIVLGSALYALSTVLFIFPHSLLLGGTSGISVILTWLLKISPGTILTVINTGLLVAAIFVLGKEMALRSFVGSTVTTGAIALFERLLPMEAPILQNSFISALVGAAVIALASGILFYCKSSSGGTDIIALIIKKYFKLNIGKALLLTDLLIVLVGGILSGWRIALSSMAGLLLKTTGIDGVIGFIQKRNRKKETEI